jgi:hypothetical protein
MNHLDGHPVLSVSGPEVAEDAGGTHRVVKGPDPWVFLQIYLVFFIN